MIIVNLLGGLGNQLFQYACGKAVADKLGVELRLDTSMLSRKAVQKDFTPREFELSVFNIDAKIADIKEVRKYIPNLAETSKAFHQLYRAKRILNGRHLFIERVWQRHTYIPAIEKVQDNTYLYGYFQTERFFKDIRQEIIRQFQLRPEIKIQPQNNAYIQRMEQENAVSVHIRRGDYADSRFTLLEMDTYYLKAVEEIKKRVAAPVFYIFSNDADWAKEHFSSIHIDKEFVNINSGNQSFMDMVLMSRCKHNIIANSSFSWWGAWLNQYPEKIVIAPREWYKNNIHSNELIPESWIKI